MSPLTLQKNYMPKKKNTTRPPQAHQPTTAAAATAQTQPPNTNQKLKSKTKKPTTTNKNIKITLTKFKNGFKKNTKNKITQTFNRPPKLFKKNTPFYPWLPKLTPLINFHLNFKG